MRFRLDHLVTLIGFAAPAIGGCATPVPAAGPSVAARMDERPTGRLPERERPCWRRTDDTLLPPGRTLRASRCETAAKLEAACGHDDERACYGAHRLAALARVLVVDAVFIRSWMHQGRDTERKLVESKRVSTQKLAALQGTEASGRSLPYSNERLLRYALATQPPVSVVVETPRGKDADGRLAECDQRGMPELSAWLSANGKTWTPVQINGCSEVYGADEVDFIVYRTAANTYLSVVTNGPACVPAELFVLGPERADLVAYWCGG